MKLTVQEIMGFAEDAKQINDYLARVQATQCPFGMVEVQCAMRRIRQLADRLIGTEVRVS